MLLMKFIRTFAFLLLQVVEAFKLFQNLRSVHGRFGRAY